MFRFNYIIYLPNDFYEVAWSDVIGNSQVKYKKEIFTPTNKLVKCLHRLHHSVKLNTICRLPWKQIWYPCYYQQQYPNFSEPNCFVFGMAHMSYNYYREYVFYVKKKYPTCKCVLFLQDRVVSYYDSYTHQPLLPNEFKQFDLVISYSPKDAAKYDLLYHPTVFSNVVVPPSDLPETDVYFVGKAKERLNDILAIYDQLTQRGYCCDFHITEVSQEKQVQKHGITYNQPMTYMQNLQHVVKAKYLLELMAGEADGCSFRTWEAMRYNKILLTNNQSVLQTPFYDAKKCVLIDEKYTMADNAHAWIDTIPDCDLSAPWHTQPKTPMDLLEFIDSKL